MGAEEGGFRRRRGAEQGCPIPHRTCHHRGWELFDPPSPGKGWGRVVPLRWVTLDPHGLCLSCSPAQDRAGGGRLCCEKLRGKV